VDYVELDPMIISMAEERLPDNYYKALRDPRVAIKNIDGRSFIKTAKDKYDCVIMRLGDPYTAQVNRYYTAEFFNEVKRILKKDGILSFAISSSESYISKALGEFLQSIYATAKKVFKDVLVVPGETAYFLASDTAGYLTYDYKILEDRTRSRALDTQYVREYYLFSKLSPANISYVERVVKGPGERAIRINYDSHPTSYYYGLIFWSTLFKDSLFSRILRSATEPLIWQAIGIFIILLAAASNIYRRSFKRACLIAIMTGGFSSMAFQILILLTFQTMHGYLFYKLGFILTAFMAGLAIGAIFTLSALRRISTPGVENIRLGLPYYDRALLMAAQGDFFILSLVLAFVFSRPCPDILFPILSAIAGSIGGSQFVVANKVLTSGREDAGRIGGLSYGVDLLGSFFGALLTGVFLIPILGVTKTCIAIALINIAVLSLLALNVRVEE